MIKLFIDNSYSQIEGLSSRQLADLGKELSSEEEAYGYTYLRLRHVGTLKAKNGKVFFKDQRGIPRPVLDRKFKPFSSAPAVKEALKARQYAMILGYIVKRNTLLGEKGDFPTGLLPRVQSWLKLNGTKALITDHRKVPEAYYSAFSLRDIPTPYPEQLEAARMAANASRGAIIMPTGTGKTVAMALLINELQRKVLLVVPNLGLKKQLTESLRKYFGSLDNITVENIDSSQLTKPNDYDALIIDEAHHAAAATYRKLNKGPWKGIYFRYYFTATPFRSRQAEEIVLESIIGKEIYRLSFNTAVAKGYICPIECYFYRCPQVIPSNPKSWQSVYSELVVNNEHRNALIASLIDNLHGAGQSTLVLVKELAHGEALSRMTGAAFAHGENDETPALLSWFSEGKLKTLIATTGVAGEGIDTKAAEYVLLCGGGKSRNAFVQQVGRVLRRFPGKESGKVILFQDESHEWLDDHFNNQCEFMRQEFGVEPVELELPEAA